MAFARPGPLLLKKENIEVQNKQALSGGVARVGGEVSSGDRVTGGTPAGGIRAGGVHAGGVHAGDVRGGGDRAGGTRPAGEIQLVAVQMRLSLDDYWSREAFERKIESLVAGVRRAVDPSLPALVAFPEDVGLMLVVQGFKAQLGNAATVGEAIARATRALFWQAVRRRALHRLSWVPALYLSRHRTIAQTYVEVFAEAARSLGAYVAAGSAVLPRYRVKGGRVQWNQPLGSRVYNTAYLFDPGGRVIGVQRKVHLIDLEMKKALDLAAGELGELTVVDTALGRVGVAICLDCFQDDVAESLARGGTQVLVQPSANPAPWTAEEKAGWQESAFRRTCVQKLFAYAVNPMMTGRIFDIEFYGQSTIVGQGGVLREASTADGEEILVATVPHPSALDP